MIYQGSALYINYQPYAWLMSWYHHRYEIKTVLGRHVFVMGIDLHGRTVLDIEMGPVRTVQLVHGTKDRQCWMGSLPYNLIILERR